MSLFSVLKMFDWHWRLTTEKGDICWHYPADSVAGQTARVCFFGVAINFETYQEYKKSVVLSLLYILSIMLSNFS